MQTYIVRVYRARPGNIGVASGIIEDVESGQRTAFHSINELQTMLGDSIAKGQLGFSDLTAQEMGTDKVAMAG